MNDDRAKSRFFLIQALRISGVVMVLAGMLILNGVIALPKFAGFILAAVGLIDALYMPTFLARRWKTPRP